ncbi:hypothetical protein WR164_15720 [Philodulcilactobacillus myokoensis]|uniref:ABC transporter domain-containing protein n=1 Tax=Philodulcilactobacillus myokoensis TaxID=2929573 RepID=A0A9W6B3W7_9LACO|nr:ABC transporter ATP-binding protein [Philodulcilactobacillus myokoensis]GLB47593.1 hypothetical protein WR164_15720 [Philodulcilactobacillus myokoensis]
MKINGPINEIKFRQFSFDQFKNVRINNLNTNIKRGQMIYVIGSSGIGKTTLINCMLGFIKNYKGKIYYNHHDLKTLNLNSLRKNISLVSQDTTLFNDTIYNNLIYGLKNIPTHEKILKLFNYFKINQNLINQKIVNNGANLSGGQKQRISLIRAIVRRSDILILDEATAALDVDLKKKVYQYLNQFHSNQIIICITHDTNLINPNDKVIFISNDKTICTSFDKLKQNYPSFQKLN